MNGGRGIIPKLKVNDIDFYTHWQDTYGMAIVKFTAEAAKEAEGLPVDIHKRVLAIAKRLEDWPMVSGVKRLTGNLAGWYRMRTGDYRILFRVEGDIVAVVKIGHRKDVYED